MKSWSNSLPQLTFAGDKAPSLAALASWTPDRGYLDLGPRTVVQGSGKVAGKVLTVDL